MTHAKFWRWVELLALFVVMPLAITLAGQSRLLVAALWIFASGVLLHLRMQPGFNFRAEWNAGAVTRAAIARMMRLYVPALAALSLLVWVLPHGRFFSLPLERPQLWLMVMTLYPLLSVLPQELIYRSFFWRRYALILPSEAALVGFSAVLFAFAHIVLNNAVAVGLCLIGGWMFAKTYASSRSLALACVQHALYGCTVFTLGLGWYFYSGAH